MLKLDVPWRELLLNEFTQRSYLRPFLWAELKLVYDAAAGDYFTWYRGVHVAQAAALIGLFVHLARPRTWAAVAALALGLAALVGGHTFTRTVIEAFPVNTFMTILLCCLTAAAISLGAHRWWRDVAAVLLFVLAALTVESGLLVAVIFVGAWLLGARGVSGYGVSAVIALFAGYFLLRFVILDVGSPNLMERSSGYGFDVLDPSELNARFGGNPWPFYAYNVVCSLLSVLIAEPRAGTWRLVHGIVLADPQPFLIVNVIASGLGTSVIAWYAWSQRRAWLAGSFDRDARLVLLFVIVLGANAVISYPYLKDEVMSPAGAFYALALYVAVTHLVGRLAESRSWRRPAVTAVCCLVLGGTWAIRDIGVHANLRSAALRVRNDWAYADGFAARQGMEESARATALLEQLQQDALFDHPAPPAFPVESRLLDVE
jgi:hypothetical protein